MIADKTIKKKKNTYTTLSTFICDKPSEKESQKVRFILTGLLLPFSNSIVSSFIGSNGTKFMLGIPFTPNLTISFIVSFKHSVSLVLHFGRLDAVD